MGVTIDKTISELEILKKSTFSYMTANQAFTTAIATMRKYQKIAEIVTNNELEWGNTSVRANALLEIKKVIEDGNDDN